MWFRLNGDERLNRRCDSDECYGQPTWRLEVGGIASNYCSGCKERIEQEKVLPGYTQYTDYRP